MLRHTLPLPSSGCMSEKEDTAHCVCLRIAMRVGTCVARISEQWELHFYMYTNASSSFVHASIGWWVVMVTTAAWLP
jgi:hypothetical protein